MLQLPDVNVVLGASGDWTSNGHFNIWEDRELPTMMEEPTPEKQHLGRLIYTVERERVSCRRIRGLRMTEREGLGLQDREEGTMDSYDREEQWTEIEDLLPENSSFRLQDAGEFKSLKDKEEGTMDSSDREEQWTESEVFRLQDGGEERGKWRGNMEKMLWEDMKSGGERESWESNDHLGRHRKPLNLGNH
ncbi:hypothetical protein Cgig2_027227 [Carnegiea gigantea]|uniref:Uncharacterized protein n=1 Tax=Carnegiea gigantea TaxID=171969 RepID=A0A9Q1K3R2_9CARY|nr:hypothetical protein Cgig2_027227 [Carnegiea gigantea]